MSSSAPVKAKSQTSECPICGKRTSWLFSAPCDYRKPDKNRPFDVNWCAACGYGFIWERPTREEVSSFYEIDSYYTHTSRSTSSDGNNNKESFLDKLRVHLAWRLDKGQDLSLHDAKIFLNGKSFSMLEIGCGNGRNMAIFSDGEFSVVGVEPDPKARNAAQEAGHTVYEGTAEELPAEILNQEFDVVLMTHVLEHCLDINSAILNARRVLKKGGIFILETPNCDTLGFIRLRSEWPWSDIPRHLNFFTKSSLNSILAKHGFEVITTRFHGFCQHFSLSWLAKEEEIWRSFRACDKQLSTKPKFKLRAWSLLMRSLFSSNAGKYDSVRLIARKN